MAKAAVSKARGKRPTAQETATTAAPQGGTLFERLAGLQTRHIILLVGLLACLAYANALGGEFVFDDTEQIVENPAVRSWDNLGRAFTTHVWQFRDRPETLRAVAPLPYYRPLFTVLLTVEYQLFGVWPQGWHMVSLLLHILCAAGVYFVLLRLSRRREAAALAAAIFAAHPIHVESVSWVSGMTDPLFGLFFLFSFYFYLKYRDEGRRANLLVSLLFFLPAAYSKETALSLVPLVFAYEFIGHAGDEKGRPFGARAVAALRAALPYFGVALLYLIPRYLVLGGLTWQNPRAHQGPFTDTLLTLPGVILSYTGHLVWPVNLSVAYATSFVTEVTSARFLLPAALLAAAVALLVVYRAKVGRPVWHALALLFVPLLPVLDLRQLAVEYLVWDHYLYLPSVGWAYLLALGLARWARAEAGRAGDRPVAPTGVAAVVLIVALVVVTALENRAWANSLALWSQAARVRPGYWQPHYNVGLELLARRDYAGARDALERAAHLVPGRTEVLDALGRAYDGLGDAERAIEHFRRALDIDPAMFESLNNLGTVYFKRGDYPAAEKQFVAALQVTPQAAAARYNLALCLARQGRPGDAAREFEGVLKYAPNDADVHYHLGTAHRQAGRNADAVAALRRGLALKPPQELVDKINEQLRQVESRGR